MNSPRVDKQSKVKFKLMMSFMVAICHETYLNGTEFNLVMNAGYIFMISFFRVCSSHLYAIRLLVPKGS